MDEDKIFANPCNKMVFECAFDDLMKEVRCEEFVYVSSWKVGSEWLAVSIVNGGSN